MITKLSFIRYCETNILVCNLLLNQNKAWVSLFLFFFFDLMHIELSFAILSKKKVPGT